MPSLVQARAGPASAPPGAYAPLAVEWSVDMVVVKKARTRRAIEGVRGAWCQLRLIPDWGQELLPSVLLTAFPWGWVNNKPRARLSPSIQYAYAVRKELFLSMEELKPRNSDSH